jgi:predicted nucleotidyltransferase
MTKPQQEAGPVEYGDRAQMEDGQILRTVVGSGVHGIAIEGTDDHDEMGIFLERPSRILGVEAYRRDYTSRTVPEGARSGPGDTDLVVYELRKYLRLAIKGNPTVLLPLYCPTESVIFMNGLGRDLRLLRSAFLSRHAVHRFLGYMQAQQERMNGDGKRNRVPYRPDLIAAHGYDTKYASHALRLAYQGREIATTGGLTLPLPEDQRMHVLAVKRGELSRESVNQAITELSAQVEEMLRTGRIEVPEEPNMGLINDFAVYAYKTYWDTYWTAIP